MQVNPDVSDGAAVRGGSHEDRDPGPRGLIALCSAFTPIIIALGCAVAERDFGLPMLPKPHGLGPRPGVPDRFA